MLALFLSLAAASDFAPFGRVDLDPEGVHLTGAVSTVVSPGAFLLTGVTWQDGVDFATPGLGVGRLHGDVGLVGEVGALHVLGLLGAGYDGWERQPLGVGRVHAVVELPPLPFLLEHRAQVEWSADARIHLDQRSMLLYRAVPGFAVGAQFEPNTTWSLDEGTKQSGLPLGLRANFQVDATTLGVFAAWDALGARAYGRLTAVFRL
ncbi:MAG: hypothetical protein EP330_30180 [Deltaproteobacteria bacterium]|nr:MAG: hypothetical protein EP330_30180 [Deltaproteobacteria bacterium]